VTERPSRGAALAAALLALIAVAFAFQGARGIWETTEGRYVDVACEMLRSGDWLHPRLDEERPHYTKPPLTYWSIAGAIGVLGPNELATRVPAALAFLVQTALVAILGIALAPRSGPWPAVVFASMLFPATAANVVSTDPLLALFETMGMAGLATRLFGSSSRSVQIAGWLAGWGGFGLAFLVKGWPALLPLASVAVFVALCRPQSDGRTLGARAGLLLMMVVGLWWPIAVVLQNPELLRTFLVDELAGRLAGEHHRNPQWWQAFVVYGPVLVVGSLPWWPEAARGVFGPLAAWTRARFRRRAAVGDRERFLLLWLLVPLAVFLVARSRLPLYLLPSFAPLALLAARRLAARPWFDRRLQIRALVGVGLILAVRLAAAFVPVGSDARPVARDLEPMLQPEIRELVFVDLPPVRGLALYLGVEVEMVETDPTGAVHRGSEMLSSELRDTEHGRLWLVRADRVAHFEKWAGSAGGEPERIGELQRPRNLVVYRFVAGAPASSP
jgi:4-amino-4-deoxy-L-arabinose transferase